MDGRDSLHVRTPMQPRLWGPPTWRLLHAIGHAAAKAEARAANGRTRTRTTRRHLNALAWVFIGTLQDVLPCSLCRASFGDFRMQLSAFERAQDVEGFLYALHNKVNEKLGKGPAPALSTVRESLAMRGVADFIPVSVEDVWIVLFVFGSCADALPKETTECTARHIEFIRFAVALAHLLPHLHRGFAPMSQRLLHCFGRDSPFVLQEHSACDLLSTASSLTKSQVLGVANLARVRSTGGHT